MHDEAVKALTSSSYGWLAVGTFVAAYALVIAEEFIDLRKSKPVMIAAGITWILVAMAYGSIGDTHSAAELLRHNLMEYAGLLLFLLAAMTYVNTLEDRNIFRALKSWLVSAGYSLRAVFWLTGVLAFCISPVADNLTTALVMGAVILAIGAGSPQFIGLACINVVVAANAGGAFSPFGDITTLMVWQKELVTFSQFFSLLVPSAVNWLVPAVIISLAIPQGHPVVPSEAVQIKTGGLTVVALFIGTIIGTVLLHHYLHLPPFLGMMTGLGVLKVHGYFIRRRELEDTWEESDLGSESLARQDLYKPATKPFDIFNSMKRVEWDTLMFFYGILLCVGGLGALGYLTLLSASLYLGLGPTWANVLVGLASAVIDNIPIMYAVISMNPEMSLGQWLLVTLTAGVGGSLLSIGSAAGVALMGQARGVYTFFLHLRWTWAISLGYGLSIWVHLVLNRSLF